MRVAVTGGTGFLGRAVMARLGACGHETVAVARGRISALEEVELRQADLEDSASWRGAFDGCDAVIHAAAGIAYWERKRSWLEAVNVRGTRAVCEEALRAGVRRFVHVSSISAIGHSESGQVLDEESPFTSEALHIGYFDTKRDAEHEVQAAVERGLSATIVNPGAIFGPSTVRSNTNDFLKAIANGRFPFVPPGVLNLIDRRSVAEGIVRALEGGAVGRRYLLTGESVSYGELFAEIQRLGGRHRRRCPLPGAVWAIVRGISRALDVIHWTRPPFTREALLALTLKMRFTNERARRELGWRPRPLDEALGETLAWIQAGQVVPAAGTDEHRSG